MRTKNTLPPLLKVWIDLPLRGSMEIIPVYGKIPVSIFQIIEKGQFQARDIIVSLYPLKITSRDKQNFDFINLFNDSKKVYLKVVTDNNCCAPSCCTPENNQNISIGEISKKMGYSIEELQSIPDGANMGLGCGNPQAIADLGVGETVLMTLVAEK